MWYEKRRQQHRVYWRLAGGRDYEAFPTEEEARRFIAQCKKLGRDVMVTAYRAAQFDPAGPTAIGLPASPATTVPARPTDATIAPTPLAQPDHTAAPRAEVTVVPEAASGGTTVTPSAPGTGPKPSPEATTVSAVAAGAQMLPVLAAGLVAPVPVGITIAWLGEQYVSSGNKGNDNTRSDYRRDLERYVYPFFREGTDGDVDIAMIMTRPLPTSDGARWPWPTIAEWKAWLAQQPRHDRHGHAVPGAVLADKTRRNIESLLSQVFNFALGYDPQPLLSRNPCTPLGLTVPQAEECLWLERNAAALVVESIDCWYRPLVKFLLATGVRWGEAAALQVKDVHLGDGTQQDPAWVYVHKTWKRVGKEDNRRDGTPGRGTHVWGRGRTKTPAGRRRISLHDSIRAELAAVIRGRDPQEPVFTGKQGGILHNSNFTQRYLIPALERAQETLLQRRATATTAAELAELPLTIPNIRPHAFRHTHAAWLFSGGRPEAEVQRRLGHADAATTRKVYGHLSREVSLETLRFLQDHLASIMVIGHVAVVTAAEDNRLDHVDEIDAALPLVDPDEDDLAA